MQIIVSREARKDLLGIRKYIVEELLNPDAARRIIAQIRKSVLTLASFPWRGRPLDALISVHTEYRYLVCENYCIFYVIGNETIIVARILHQRQNCVRALLTQD